MEESFPRGGHHHRHGGTGTAGSGGKRGRGGDAGGGGGGEEEEGGRARRRFRRGGGDAAAVQSSSSEPPSSHTDLLFGGGGDRERATEKRKKEEEERQYRASAKSKSGAAADESGASGRRSMLPLGGGAVAQHNPAAGNSKGGGTSSSNHYVIESLSFNKIRRGMKLMARVKEAYSDLVVFSLPNLWTGYMLPPSSSGPGGGKRGRKHRGAEGEDDEDEDDLSRTVSVGQYLSVVVVKAVQETTRDGPRRRIQVDCRPSAANNPAAFEQGVGGGNAAALRGQVVSVEDHGLLVDLGWNRRGFLPLDRIEGEYSLADGDDDEEEEEEEEEAGIDDDDKKGRKEPPRCLAPGRILDFVVDASKVGGGRASGAGAATVVPLKLPTQLEMATRMSKSKFPSLSAIQPGELLRCQVEALLQNGLAVTFGDGVYRGSIELSHLGGYWFADGDGDRAGGTNKKRTIGGGGKDDEPAWRKVFKRHMYLTARVLAVDAATKIVRLTLQPHLLALAPSPEPPLPPIGTVVERAAVCRHDPGIGALLVLPASTGALKAVATPVEGEEKDEDDDDDDHSGKENDIGGKDEEARSPRAPAALSRAAVIASHLNADLWKKDSYRRAATQTQAVYVHISKAMDEDGSGGDAGGKKKRKGKATLAMSPPGSSSAKLDAGTFAKRFGESSRHDVRILSTATLEGIATGSTAKSVVAAHVLSHADVQPAATYRQVPIVAHLQNKKSPAASSSSASFSVLVHLGMGVRGLIPSTHLFDSSTASRSDYRDKVARSMFAVGNKVPAVRVLQVNVKEKRCMLTAKKSLLKTKDVVTSFEEVRVGQKATGFISKVDKHGGLFVTFFNGVYGRVTAKSLLVELGVTVEECSYQIGDVVECRVVNIKKKTKKRGGGSAVATLGDDEDDMDVDDADADEGEEGSNDPNRRHAPCHWELTLSLRTNADDDDEDEDNMEIDTPAAITPPTSPGRPSTSASPILHILAGGILPLRSIRIVELVHGRDKNDASGRKFVSGYALVSVKSKYLLNEADRAKAPPYIDCKLPYDQILDEYDDSDLESAATMDCLAEKLLTVGKKINRKGLILTDPGKLSSEYTSGTGKLTVISIRPKLIELAEKQQARQQEASASSNPSDDDVILPAPDAHLFVGANLIGYVAQLDPRHGAFVRFLNGLTGLVPKLKGGLDLKLFGTVVTRVVALDVTARPMKILLGKIGDGEHPTTTHDDKSKNSTILETSLEVGDTISEVEVSDITFHRTIVKFLDDNVISGRYRARLHATMAESEPLKEHLNSALDEDAFKDQVITKFHPFYGLREGSKLSSLRVANIDARDGTVYLELTNRQPEVAAVQENDVGNGRKNPAVVAPAPIFIEEASDLTRGQKVSGIITAVDYRKEGLWLHLSPGVSGFVPALELSNDPDVLNNFARHFPVGCRLECVVLDKYSWHRTRAKYYSAFIKHKKNDEQLSSRKPHPLLLSHLLTKDTRRNWIPKPFRGDLLVGRISHSLPKMLAPALMLELRGGYVGRCCICELEEPDDWVNMPLGHEESAPKTRSKDNDSDEDDDSVNKETSASRMSVDAASSKSPYPSGLYVKCQVLNGVHAKPVVEVSLRKSRIDGDLDEDEPPEVGELAHAYVVTTNKKGCFLRLTRKIEGRAILKELCDGFLPDPAASFPTGRLVVGKVKVVSDAKKKSAACTFTKVADIDMRESVLVDVSDKIAFGDIQIGQKYKGTVTRIEEYGVFVRIENSDVSGLVHKSECSDNYVKSLPDLYDPGDLVKILVLKKDPEKKQLGFSMKASHFENDEDSDSDDESMDGDSDAEDEEEEAPTPVRELGRNPVGEESDLDSDDENMVAKLAAKVNKDDRSVEDDGSDSSSSGEDSEDSEDESDSDEEDAEKVRDVGKAKKGIALDTDVGFDWGGLPAGSSKPNAESDEDDSSSDDEDAPHKASHKSRKKQAQRLREEQEIARREAALADGTADENPETTADFERLLAASPDSSELWIKYMAFHLSLADTQAAKAVAERAFERISFRQEGERLNVWCALLTLELKYGTEEDMQSTIDRACQHNNPKHVYLRVCEMLENQYQDSAPDSVERVDAMYAKMCKKFKDKKTVWIAHVEYLLKSNRPDEAHATSKRALQSLPAHKHVETMTKVAQLVFEYSSPEKARTLFDGLLLKYPKRLDLFFVYVDKEVKHGDIETARSLFERQVAPPEGTAASAARLKLSEKKMKSFFKKWYSFEEQNGTPETQDRVKEAARAYVEQAM